MRGARTVLDRRRDRRRLGRGAGRDGKNDGMATADQEKAEQLSAFFNERFPGASARYGGPDDANRPAVQNFHLPGAGIDLVIEQAAYETWPGTQDLIERTFAQHGLLDDLQPGGGTYRVKRSGERLSAIRAE